MILKELNQQILKILIQLIQIQDIIIQFLKLISEAIESEEI